MVVSKKLNTELHWVPSLLKNEAKKKKKNEAGRTGLKITVTHDWNIFQYFYGIVFLIPSFTILYFLLKIASRRILVFYVLIKT